MKMINGCFNHLSISNIIIIVKGHDYEIKKTFMVAYLYNVIENDEIKS